MSGSATPPDDGLSDAEREALREHEAIEPIEQAGDLNDTEPLDHQRYEEAIFAGRSAVADGKSARAVARLLMTVIRYGAKAAL